VAIIVASALGALGFSAALALALGRVAASADESSERMLAESRAAAESTAFRRGYAGWARTQSLIARESRTTARSPRSRMGAQRLPVRACASRRPAMRSSRPGREARP